MSAVRKSATRKRAAKSEPGVSRRKSARASAAKDGEPETVDDEPRAPRKTKRAARTKAQEAPTKTATAPRRKAKRVSTNGAELPAPEADATAPNERRGLAGNGAASAHGDASAAWPAFPSTNYALAEKVLVRFVHDEVTRVGVEKVVLGVSGGVDSACAAAIAVRALGADHVIGVNMPYRASSPASARDAASVADALGIELRTIDITPQIDAYFASQSDASKERRGNKMARERMTILYDLSARERALVLGTSNKTELLLGYGTLYGDMASALNPIGDLYKTQIWGLASHVGVPEPIVEKAPSADLWEGQTDEHELGFGYREVDALLYRMVDERWSDTELLAAGFESALVARVRSMVRSSQFKRRLPLIAKISERTIDADFRYPRDWGT